MLQCRVTTVRINNRPSIADNRRRRGRGIREDGFVPDGMDAPAERAGIAPLGPQRRPNGTMYLPRKIGPVEDLAFLRTCRSRQEHVLLYGPSGTGKTAVLEAACAPDARPADANGPAHPGFEQLTMGINTMEADLLGTFTEDRTTGRHVWVDGPLTKAVRLDVPFIADEILLADSRVLAPTLYALMDGRGVLAIPANPAMEPLPVGPGFVVYATGNPGAPGAEFSEALRTRFDHHVEVDTDWLLASELGVPADIIPICRSLDKIRRAGELPVSPQLRELLAYRDTAALWGVSTARQALVGRMPFEVRPALIQALKNVFEVEYGPLRSGARATG